MIQDPLPQFAPADLQVGTLSIHLLVALLLGHALGWHFIRYAPVMGNKQKLARVFVWVSATTLLIISVVKVSLALSLGLVGALSIIRFRTPIKEPEELAYLFLAVAVGVGLGAERLWETVLVFTVVLAVMALRGALGGRRSKLRTVLHVALPGPPTESLLSNILSLVSTHCDQVDLRRVDKLENEFQASLLVEFASAQRLQALITAMTATWSAALISVVEREGVE